MQNTMRFDAFSSPVLGNEPAYRGLLRIALAFSLTVAVGGTAIYTLLVHPYGEANAVRVVELRAELQSQQQSAKRNETELRQQLRVAEARESVLKEQLVRLGEPTRREERPRPAPTLTTPTRQPHERCTCDQNDPLCPC